MKQSKISQIGEKILFNSIALILLWYGIFKFTPTEAEAIKGLIENSPFFSWMYAVLSIQSSSNIIGTFEIVTAILILLGNWNNKLLRIGGYMGAITFLGTLSFLFTTPKMFKMIDWMPITNGFIVKDLTLLAGCIMMIASK